MLFHGLKLHWFGAAMLLVAVILTAACGAEPTPIPEPTPTATPEPTPIPATATPIPVADEPVASMEDFVIDESTTGRDLIDRLSGEEDACIKTTLGDAFYALILDIPLMSGGTDPAAAALLFNCMTPDNVAVFGAAILDAQAGGRTPETRQCLNALYKEHPETLYLLFGLEWEGDVSQPDKAYDFTLQAYACMNSEERVALTLTLWEGVIAKDSTTGRDLVDTLTESEATCVRETLSDELYEQLLDVPFLANTPDYPEIRACLSEQGTAGLFVHVFAVQLGGVSDETHSCLSDFANAHPHYVEVLSSGPAAAAALGTDAIAELGDDAIRFFDCLTSEELGRYQELVTRGYQGS